MTIDRDWLPNEIEAAFEHEVTQQTQAYQFKQSADGWLFRCDEWIDITAILRNLTAKPELPEGPTP